MVENYKLITCQNVSFGYEGQAVIRDLSFSVDPGEYLWVVGENGSGKTTLIMGILKLLNPMDGSLTFSDKLARGRIGYLSQQSAPRKDFPAGVYEIVLSGNLSSMGLRPIYSSKEKSRAEEAMECLGIKDLRKKCYRELSAGQQRRVLLARAFCAAQVDSSAWKSKAASYRGAASSLSPASNHLLVLDEPAAGLDPLITAEVYDLLKTLNEQTGISIIMVSHDTRGAEQYADHILHMENGRGFFSTMPEYLSSDRGRKFFGHEKEKSNGN
jgi:zinc transport system ATP-binding protein